MGRLLALIGALIAAGLIAWAGEQTPRLVPATAPATVFSAERALADIGAMASVPHPVGSAQDRATRDYLLRRMTALGLSPQVRPGVGVDRPKSLPNGLLGGYVEDIVGVLPGRDRSLPALALMAHYDSVPGSPGASDDAAGVSSALELVRAFQAKGQPARDVMLLITDGEEGGLLGADAFFRADPLARRVGYVINMEARGSAGRTQMFQTADANGADIQLLLARPTRQQGSSFTGFVYAHMPNDTDFTVSKRAGVPGLNFAFLGRQFDYHSPSSTPAAQDPGTLQDMGDQVMGPADAVAYSAALPPRAPDLVYGNTPGGLLIAYPPTVGWLILAVAAGLIAWGVTRARAKAAFPWLDLARGAGAALFALATAAALLHLARQATGAAVGYFAQRFLLAQAPRWETALILISTGALLLAAAHASRGKRWTIALLPLLAGLASLALNPGDKLGLVEGVAGALIAIAVYGRPASRPGAWAGVLVLTLVLAIAVQAVAPLAAFVLAWPLALAALAGAVTAMGAHRGTSPILLLAAFAAVGLALAASFAHAAILSLDLTELLCLPLLMAAAVVWPLAQTEEGAPPARLLGPALIVLGLAVTVAVRFNHPYDARHPQMTYVVYDLDQDAKKAWRFSYAPERNAWTTAVLTADGGKVGKKTSGRRDQKVDAAPARYFEAPAPQITLARDTAGVLHLRVQPPPGARVIDLKLQVSTPATLVSAGGAGVRLAMKPSAATLVRWSAAQPGFELVIEPAGPGKLTAAYSATLEQWPSSVAPLPPRPKDVMPMDLSDSTAVEGTRSFSW